MRRRWQLAGMAGLALALVVIAGPVPYTAPSGDLNLDGHVDSVDLQCEVLAFSALVTAAPLPGDQCQSDADCLALVGPDFYCRPGFTKKLLCLPVCVSPLVPVGKDIGILCNDPAAKTDYCRGTTQVRSLDMNCDGTVGNADLIYLVAVIMGAVGWPGTADHDGDGQLNFCDSDSDGDGDPDATDCEVLDETVSTIASETCNGLDDNCNGKVDEWLGTVSCGVGECAHSEPACVDGTPTQCNPLAGAAEETCNGVDDDCDGKVDDGPGDLLCMEFSAAPHVLGVDCFSGDCLTTLCETGYFDTNGSPVDGCECSQDAPNVQNGTCQTAVSLGTLTDFPSAVFGVASNEPTGDGDWYRFDAKDVAQAGTDTFHVRVKFLDNPGGTYVIDLHYASCDADHRICSEAAEADWATDFIAPGNKTAPPAIPGPWAVGGGESDCRSDPDHTLTPTDFSDDTSDTTHQCTDNSATFYLRVYVAPGKKVTCLPYKIEISNGIK
jgi:hypothetical protein